jgi:hypothetical protein
VIAALPAWRRLLAGQQHFGKTYQSICSKVKRSKKNSEREKSGEFPHLDCQTLKTKVVWSLKYSPSDTLSHPTTRLVFMIVSLPTGKFCTPVVCLSLQ